MKKKKKKTNQQKKKKKTKKNTIYKGKKGCYPNNNLFYLLSRSFMFNKRHFLFDHKVLRILLICFLPAGRHFLEPESEQLRIDLPSEMDSS